MSEVLERRSSNRARMPTVAAIVDEYRSLGLTVTVIHATENGITVGKKPTNENAFDIPPGYRLAAAVAKAQTAARVESVERAALRKAM